MTSNNRTELVRRICRAAICLGLLLALPSQTAIHATALWLPARIRLYHTHTNERIDIVYRLGGDYVPEALSALDHFLRDHRTGDVHHFDPQIFDLLADLTAATGHPGTEVHIICGYRSPVSNEFLRTRTASSGVAKNSLHMQAEAIDIRIPSVKTATLRDAALALGRGGVGYYAQSGFVHVDVGRVRRW